MDREQYAARVDVEVVVEALDRHILELHAVDRADIGDDDIELPAVRRDIRVEPIEIFELANVALHPGAVLAE